jgi:peroxiredoxin
MNLTQELADLNSRHSAQTSPEQAAAAAETKEAILRAGITRTALRQGAKMPAFSLPDADGQVFRSADLLAKGPLIISFYRGGWCSYCNLELNALRLALPEIEARGATLVGVSPEVPSQIATTKEKTNVNFVLLSDQGNGFAKQMGLVYRLPEAMQDQFRQNGVVLPEINGDESWELPLPATYLIGQDGTIRDAFVDPDYYRRKDPQELLEILGPQPGHA